MSVSAIILSTLLLFSIMYANPLLISKSISHLESLQSINAANIFQSLSLHAMQSSSNNNNSAEQQSSISLSIPLGVAYADSRSNNSTTSTSSTEDTADAGSGGIQSGNPTVLLSGTLYNDKNANGKRDLDDSGISGASIQVSYRPNGTSSQEHGETLKTGEDGSYRTFLPSTSTLIGIQTAVPEGYFETEGGDVHNPSWDNNNNNSSTLTSSFLYNDVQQISGKNIDFGFASIKDSAILVTGMVYEDLNGNGKRDSGEPGISDVGINISYLHPFTEYRIQTLSDGTYQAFLSPTAELVSESSSEPEGMTRTQPVNDVQIDNTTRTIASGIYEFGNLGSLTGPIQNIDFGYANPVANLTVRLQDENGNSIKGPSISFNDATTGQYIDTKKVDENGSVSISWIPAHKVNASIEMGSILYHAPNRNETIITLTRGRNNQIIHLDALKRESVAGTVTDVGGRPIDGMTITASEKVDSRNWFYSSTTDNAGHYNFTLLQGLVTIKGSNASYIVNDKSLDLNKADSPVKVDLTAELMPIHNVTTNVYSKYVGSGWVGPVNPSSENFFTAELTDEFGNHHYPRSDGLISFRGVLGDKIEECVRPYATFRLPESCRSMVLNDTQSIAASFYLQEGGRIEGRVIDAVTADPVSSWNAYLYSLNNDGRREWISSFWNNSQIIDVSVPKAGLYQLDIYSTYNDTDVSSHGSINPSNHFAQITTMVDNDKSALVGDVKLLRERSVVRNEGNAIASTPATAAPGNTITLHVSFNSIITQGMKNTPVLLLEVPANTTLVDKSIVLNGKQAAANYDGGAFYQIPLDGVVNGTSLAGTATYKIRLNDDFDKDGLNISAFLQYDSLESDGGIQKRQEVIGSLHIPVPQLSIDIPHQLTQRGTMVSGQGPAGGKIELYDGNTLLGQTDVSQGGFWRMNVTLPDSGDPAVHVLHANGIIINSSSKILHSRDATVIFDSTSPKLIEVCMQQDLNNRVCVNPELGVARFPYLSVWQYPYNFELRFDHPERVSDVKVFLDGTGGGMGNATLGSDGVYRATIVPSDNKSLGNVDVVYKLVPPDNISKVRIPTLPIQIPPPAGPSPGKLTIQDNNETDFSGRVSLEDGTVYKFASHATKNVKHTPTIAEIKEAISTQHPIFPISIVQTDVNGGLAIKGEVFVPDGAFSSEESGSTKTDFLDVSVDEELHGTLVDFALAPEDSGMQAKSVGNLQSVNYLGTAILQGQIVAHPNGITRGALAGVIGTIVGAQLGMAGLLAAYSTISFLGALGTAFGIGAVLAAGICWAICDEVDPTYLFDPSGFVYEAVPSNRLQNVTATILEQDPKTKQWHVWDAQEFGQINPETVDSDGHYAWDVPEGDWKITYQKPGYQQASSEIIHEPPPRYDVNIGMVSLAAPSVIAVSALAHVDGGTSKNTNSSSIRVQFDKYILANNVENTTITVAGLNGITIPVSTVNAPDGKLLTREIDFVPSQPLVEGSTYSLHVTHRSIVSYASVPMDGDYDDKVVAIGKTSYDLQLTSNGHSLITNSLTNIENADTTSAAVSVTLGQPLIAIAKTNDNLASKTIIIHWSGPDGKIRKTESASPTMNDDTLVSQPFYPTETGQWTATATFADGTPDNSIASKTRNFTVNYDAPVPEFGLNNIAGIIAAISIAISIIITKTGNFSLFGRRWP
ncbi:P pilus assembly protein, porin PapC [Candidatus Nitrososphaera evergladensis SR1]|uniref:P pilus assembly protein, porin PapC n=2 Tax=Nitrososphaera TaxID=497726 RepID=A0A075MW23_9ARCH|nr:P pilus assembly protein, porin PapC [Candidatus Nitrososphaera evergladensis SR1]